MHFKRNPQQAQEMNKRNRTAVVLSSYNGEKFIIQQLDSIRCQTVSPDEVIIADDCSTDNTYEIISNYIKQYELSNWQLTQNDKNKGWKKSFYDLIDNCNADLIFPCDQDDIWDTRKVETMLPYFKNSNINLLASNFTLEKGYLNPKFNPIKTVKLKRHFFDHKIFYIQYLGCTFCLRKSFFEFIKPYYIDDIAHDAFVYIFSLLTNSFYTIDAPLIKHRIHGNNSSNEYIAKFKKIPYFNLTICDMLEKFLNENPDIDNQRKAKTISDTREWLNTRILFFETKNFLVFCKLFLHLKCYLHFRTYINDFLTIYLKHN